MKQRHVGNISTLIHFMEGLNAPGFDMKQFTHECNTPSCALGWACTVPSLAAQGCDLNKLVYGHLSRHAGSAVSMAEEAFGDYSELFSYALNREIKTPQQWADHAKAFLRSKGHEVVPPTQEQKDHFSAFMERVLKPVDLDKVNA